MAWYNVATMTDPPRQRRTTPRDADSDVLRRRNRELATLKAIAETLNKGVSLRETLASTLPLVVELLNLHTGWLFLLDDQAEFYVATHHDLPPALAYPGSRGGMSGPASGARVPA